MRIIIKEDEKLSRRCCLRINVFMPMKILDEIRKICVDNDIDVQDFSGYLRTDSQGLPFQLLMEYTNAPLTILIEGKEKFYDNAKLALMSLIGKHDVKSISIKENRLMVELASHKVEPLKLFYITNRPDVSLIAEKYGVDRIWIDLETRGKEERQKGLNTVKSHHTVDDIRVIKPLLTKSEMMVRINSWYEGSEREVEDVIDAGADIIMLPYWKSVDEVKRFIHAVNGRCKTTMLLETKEAVEIIDDVLKLGGFDEIHIGLNDLSLSYGLTFMFELLSNGIVEMLCRKFKTASIPCGFGGIAKLGDGLLPAEKIIMEHYRLGSTRAILSRTFCDTEKITDIDEIDKTFSENMNTLRDYEQSMADVTKEEFVRNKMAVAESVDEIVNRIVRVRSNEG